MKPWKELSKGRKITAIGLMCLMVYGIYFAMFAYLDPYDVTVSKKQYVSKEGYDLLKTCKKNGFPEYLGHKYIGTNNDTLLITCADVNNNTKVLTYSLTTKSYITTPWN